MATTTFSAGTVVASTWLNDVNDVVYEATQDGTGSVARTAQSKLNDHTTPEDKGGVADNSTNNQTAMVNTLLMTQPIGLKTGIYRVGTGNLTLLSASRIRGVGRERTFIRNTHATNPTFSSVVSFNTYEDLTLDRSGAVGGRGISQAGVDNNTPLEGFKVSNVNSSGHTSGIWLRDFVIASIEDTYLQSNVNGIDTDKTGANFCTLLSMKRCWLRGNTTTAALIAGVQNTHFDQVVFEGLGVTPVGLAISGGGTHHITAPWFESILLAGTFTNCGQVVLNSGYINGSSLTAHAFGVNGASAATTVVFDGAWGVQNVSGTFAIADVGATIIVRSPALVTQTFSAVNGGKVIFDVPLEAKATWNPLNCASLARTLSTTVTVTGARLGDICKASFENGTTDPHSFTFKADCFSDDTVTVSGFNESAGALDLASGTLSVRVQKRALIS